MMLNGSNRMNSRNEKGSVRLTDRLHGLLAVLVLTAFVVVDDLHAQSKGEVVSAPEFVRKLAEKGYFETAAEYIDRLNALPDLDPSLRMDLLFERATVLRQLSEIQLRPEDFEQTRKSSKRAYDEILSRYPNHAKFPQAVTEVVTLMQSELRSLLLKFRRATRGSEKQVIETEFREAALRTRREIAQYESILGKRLSEFPKFVDRDQDPELYDARQNVESAVLNLRLHLAILDYDEAEIESSDRGRELTSKALEEFDRLRKEYRTNLVGLYAALFQGRCYLRMGKDRESSGIFQELMSIRSDQKEVRDIIDEAHLNYLQVLSDQGNDKSSGEEKLQTLIRDADLFLKNRPDLNHSRIEQGIRWETAIAYEILADLHSPSDEIRENHLERALAIAVPLSREVGEFRQPANSMTARLSKRLGRDLAAATDFNAAFFECMNRVRNLESLNAALEQSNDEREQAQIALDIELQKPAVIDFLKHTLSLAKSDTPADEIVRIRYWLSYLLYLDHRFYESIVLGEFIAGNNADDPQTGSFAQEAAFLAMLAYAGAYRHSPPESNDFEIGRMIALAQFLTTKWSDHRKTDESLLILGRVLSDRNRPGEAAAWFEKVRPESNFRLEAQLAAATAYWNAYLKELADRTRSGTTSSSPISQTIAGYPDLAFSRLSAGIAEAEKDSSQSRIQLDVLLLARLTLAQILNHQGKYREARELLLQGADAILPELKNHPPDKLPEKGPRSLTFQIEATRQWLRAAIGLQNLEDSLQALEALGKLDREHTSSADLYVAVGEQFATDLDQWKSKDPRKYYEVINTFENFLIKLDSRQESKKTRIQLWIGESWSRLADRQEDPARALPYLKQASSHFNDALNLARESPDTISTELTIATKYRHAVVLRRLAEFEQAELLLRELLRQKNNAVDLQIEAARLMRDWAMQGGELAVHRWNIALQGESERPQDRLWGWGEIAAGYLREFEQHPESATLKRGYLEARYEIADCRYHMAISSISDEKEKNRILNRAVADLQFTSATTDLDETWSPKFTRLWNDIHASLGIPTPRLPTRMSPNDGQSVPEIAQSPLPGQQYPTPAERHLGDSGYRQTIILFLIVAVAAVTVAVFLNRPRKRNVKPRIGSRFPNGQEDKWR